MIWVPRTAWMGLVLLPALLNPQQPSDTAAPLPPPAAATVSFAKDVEPLLRKKCHACHGQQLQMNGLRLDDREAALKGGYSGAVILPGQSSSSKLIRMVAGLERGKVMPPAGDKLTSEEIGILRAWIDRGAEWPRPASAPAAAARPAAARSGHWSFSPPVRPPLPAVRNASWVRNPVDTFVLARLEAEDIAPSPEADKATLIRRLSLDLIGLPPSPLEVTEFLADNRPDAYERLADRLLASSRYGEKWARLWLDLGRYADSDGYEKDLVRPHAWRYRHWLIDALNRDLPFDRFTVEQIAGDLLPDATVEQRVATGFHRNTLTNREAGVDRAEARFEQLVNRVNTTGTAWLGLTVGCAQCHDHKFDPITQKDYYQLFAFFNTAEEEDLDAPLPGEMGPYLQALPEYRRRWQQLLDQYPVAQWQASWEASLREAAANPGRRLDWDFQLTSMRAMLDSAEKILNTDLAARTERQRDRLTTYFLSHPGPDLTKKKKVRKKIKEVQEKLEALAASFPALSQAQVLAEDPSPRKNHIYVRGDYRRPGVEVAPGTPSFLPPMPDTSEPPRLRFARWLVSPGNPLTTRVAVNRMWQEFFGRGLVLTSEDFGTQGERPSHPELLDWLAAEFLDRGWSVKQMHRLIVTSATYRQSSHARPELASRDPDNRLLARQSRLRLPAELVRDSALSVSGLLDGEIGGRSVRPPQPKGLAELGYANSVTWQQSEGRQRYRRGLYIHFQRTVPYPQLMSFDAPDSNVACSRRRRSNTPLQALNLLNDPVFFEAAAALGVRVLREAPRDPGSRLDYVFRLCLGREPSRSERERLARFLDQYAEMVADDSKALEALHLAPPEGAAPVEAAVWAGVGRVLLNLDEFVNRE